jgi:hypothetical protein
MKDRFYHIRDAYSYLKHKEKYIGKRPITLRSGLEINFVFKFLDVRQDVISWSNESIVIPYYDEVSKRFRRYFPDFLMTVETKDKEQKTFLIELKPYKETKPPSKRGRNYQKRLNTYITNKCKWAAAVEWCKENGYIFKILTEKEIN